MSDIKDNILDALKFRLNNKLISSIILSWCVVNYKVFIVVFGDGKYSEKIKYLESDLYDKNMVLFYVIFLPILLGVAYVFLMPYLNIWLNQIDMYFTDKERRAVFDRKKIDVVSAEEKEAFFSELQIVNQGLKEEMSRARLSDTHKVQRLNVHLEGVEKRYRALVFKKIARTLDMPESSWELFPNMISPQFHILSIPQEAIIKFVDSPIFEFIRDFALRLTIENYNTETRTVTFSKEALLGKCAISELEMVTYIDYILAFEVLKEIDYPDALYATRVFSDQNMLSSQLEHLKVVRVGYAQQ